MRRRPLPFSLILALAVFWLAADVRTGATRGDAGGTIGNLHGETMAIASSHVGLSTLSAPRKAPHGEWASSPFLSPHSLSAGIASAAATVGSDGPRIRERAPLTFTYDATAPPGETAHTVL